MPNVKGFERLEAIDDEGFGPTTIIVMISASEAHNTKNFTYTHAQAKVELGEVIRRAHTRNIRIIGCVGTVYGCPVIGDVPMEPILDLTKWFVEQGCQEIMLGDTTGQANPIQVRDRLGEIMEMAAPVPCIAHFHDTRANGITNNVTALQLGITLFDTSTGAIGGQPATDAPLYHHGYTGNTCTEDLVHMFREMGVETGIDLEKLLDAGRRAEEIVGHMMRSQVLRAGPVNHGPKQKTPQAEALDLR